MLHPIALALILASSAHAQEPGTETPPAEDEPAVDAPLPSPAEIRVHLPELGDAVDVRIGDARARLRQGDHQGARILLEQVLDREELEEARYLLGVAWELEGDTEQALQTYAELLSRWPTGQRCDDARFRIAEATGTLGRYRDALDLLDELDTTTGWSDDDRLKVALVEGIWTVQSGKERRGLRQLERALSLADPEQVTFYQAKARAVIAGLMVQDAGELSLDTRERRQVRRLDERAQLIVAAEQQVAAVATLQEPEWVLEGLLQLGRAYEAVGDDLLSARAPRRLSEEQAVIYTEEVEERAAITWVKASRYYDRGLQLAYQLDWESSRVQALEEAYLAVVAKIEGS